VQKKSSLIADPKKLDGKWLVYERSTEKLSFKAKSQDSRKYLTVGMVWGGEVAGKSAIYWLEQIAKQKKED